MDTAQRQVFEQERQKRQVAMAELRAEMKQRKIRYSSIARSSGNSDSWVGAVLRGGYPYGGAYYLPKNIRLALQEHALVVPSILWTF